MPLALVGVVAVGAVLEILVLRPLYRRGPLDQVLATFGLTMFFNELVVVIWGRVPLNLNIPPVLDGHVEIFPGVNYPVYRLAITGAALCCGGLLYLLIAHTRLGALIRAGSDKREIVEALGVNIGFLYTVVFGLGAALAGFAGMMTGPLLSVESGMGDPILILDPGGDRDRRQRLDPRRARRRAAGRDLRHVQPCDAAADRRHERRQRRSSAWRIMC